MSDFSQNGIISTLHDFGTKSLEQIEKELLRSEIRLLRIVSRPKIFLNIFWSLPESFWYNFNFKSYNFEGQSMEVDEYPEKKNSNHRIKVHVWGTLLGSSAPMRGLS